MAEESDGIEEAFDGELRVLLTAAGRVGETLSRSREEASRRAQAASEQEAREMQSRLDAERKAAHIELSNVYRNGWWSQATPEEIAHTYQTARAWTHEDPEAVRAEGRMRDELLTRYGVDINDTHADPVAVREAVERAGQVRGDSDAQRQRAASEEAEALRLTREADRADTAAEQARTAASHESDPEARQEHRVQADMHQGRANGVRAKAQPLYDSAERRSATAAHLEAKGVSATAVNAKMRADVSQAKPATEAAQNERGVAAKARKARGRATQAQRAEPGR